MINKKRQELIIQNLRSISAEVRCMSIEQLVHLPAMPVAEKISCLQQILNDSDEGVRNLAAAMIKKLQNDESGSAAPTAPAPAPAPAFSRPLTPPPSLAPSAIDIPDLSPASVASSFQPSQPSQPAVASVTQSPAVAAVSAVMPLNESIDPSLPDLKKITDISSLLQHIKTLTSQKPSGHVTQLLQLARHVMEEVALTALQALFNLKDKRVPSQIPPMLAEEQYSSQRRFLMLKIIMETDVDLDYASLESILLKEKDVIVKSGLVKVFARSSRERGIDTLIRCLQDEDPRVRANTVEVIEEQNIRGCEQHIVTLLEDPENRVKVNAAKYLVKNGYQQAFLTLRNMLVSPEVWLRDSVIFALGEIGDQPSLTLLKAALKDPNQGIRLSVLKALARINNNTSRQVLKAACGDPDPVVAQVAASLFEKIKDAPMREEVKPGSPAQAPAPNAVPPRAPVAAPTGLPTVSSPATAAGHVNPTVGQPPVPTPPQNEPVLPEIALSPVLPSVPDIQVKEPVPEIVQPQKPFVQPIVQRSPMPQMPASPSSAPAQPTVPRAINIPDRRLPSSGFSAPPARPVSSGTSAGAPPVAMVPGMPVFSKPRSAEIYSRLASPDLEQQRAGARDIAFVMGDDQMILLAKAATLEDESIRIAAVKLLSRKKTPDAIDLLQKLTNDSNETVKSLADKALQLQK